MIAVQFVCKHGREDALNKTKNGRSNGCMYSTVRIKYRLIIVKATKLLAKMGIFILLYAFAHSGVRNMHNSIQGSRLSVRAVYTEHSARVAYWMKLTNKNPWYSMTWTKKIKNSLTFNVWNKPFKIPWYSRNSMTRRNPEVINLFSKDALNCWTFCLSKNPDKKKKQQKLISTLIIIIKVS